MHDIVKIMLDIAKILGGLSGAYKAIQFCKTLFKRKEKEMQAIVDNLRFGSLNNNGNCLNPPIGSKADRLYSEMVKKGYLVRIPFGYMLPEFAPRRYGSSY
jgi:hypothetical protein